jgi:putative transposase
VLLHLVRLRLSWPWQVWAHDFLEGVSGPTMSCTWQSCSQTVGRPITSARTTAASFSAKAVKARLAMVGVKTLFIEPGSRWENGYNESFNGKLRDELLNGEIFNTLFEAQVLIERWRHHYNHRRPHSSLSCLPPAPRAWLVPPPDARSASPWLRGRPAGSNTDSAVT